MTDTIPPPPPGYVLQPPQEDTMAAAHPVGLIAPGNIDLSKRPIVRNADGSYSTVRSISIDQDGHSYLIPTVVGDRVVSNDNAIKHFQQTGENLGQFKTWQDADAYAKTLHNQQAAEYDQQAAGTQSSPPAGHAMEQAPGAAATIPPPPPGYVLQSAAPDFGDVRGGVTTSDNSPWYAKLGQGVAHGLGTVLDSADQAGRFLDTAGFYEPLKSGQDLVNRAQDYEDLTRQLGERQAQWEQGTGQSGFAKAGNLAGQFIGTLPFGGLGSPAEGVGAMLLRQAGAGAAGAVLSQPVTDPNADFVAQKLGQAVAGGATGAITGGLLRSLGRAAEEVRSKNLPFRAVAGDTTSPAAQKFAAESGQLVKETGVPLTPGQYTGSKGLTAMENAARQSSKTSDQVFQGDQTATQALDGYVQRMMRNIASNGKSPAETGDAIRDALKTKVNQIAQLRSKVADQQYGAIRQLAGGRPLIQANNLQAELADIGTEYGSIATPGAKALTRFASKTAGSELGDVTNLMKLRSYLSKVAGGQARISGEPVDRKIAAGLLQSIDNDLDASADQLGGRVGDMLKAANQNYRNFSNQIEYVQRSPLGKLLGEDVTNTMTGGSYNTIAPEKLLDRIRSMTPSEVATTRSLLEDASPETWQQAKRGLIEQALDQAHATAPSMGANTLAMQPGAFIKALGGNNPKGQAWAKALFDPNELVQLTNAFKVASRLGDRTGYNFSGTAQQLENMGKLNLPQTAMGWVQKLGANMVGSTYQKRLAAAMVAPEGRRMLLQLERLPPGASMPRNLAAFAAALGAANAVTPAAPSQEVQQ